MGDDGRGACTDDFGHPIGEHVPDDDALVAQQPVDLLDGMLGQRTARLSKSLTDDRDGERSTRHDAERRIGERLDALYMDLSLEYGVQVFMNILKSLVEAVHYVRISTERDHRANQYYIAHLGKMQQK